MLPGLGTVKLLLHRAGTRYGAGMYVVGASLLSDFWREHPECEGELRALHALLSDPLFHSVNGLFGHSAEPIGAGFRLDLPTAVVSLSINEASKVVRIASVTLKEA